jgi:hypothetical protein
LFNLGLLARAEGDLDRASRYFTRCVAIREERLGPEHPHVAGALEAHAATLRELGGGVNRAAALEERARSIRP